ncbi:MAG: hypothetical protein R2764_23625, partial [Bacteroidales bacterium]
MRETIIIVLLLMVTFAPASKAQDDNPCPDYRTARSDKVYNKGIKAFSRREYSEAIRQMNEVIDIEPGYVDAYYVLGLIYIKESRMNLNAARENFLEVIGLCPEYDIYTYYHLARIAYGAQQYDSAYKYITHFLEDVDRIKTDDDYEEAVRLQNFSEFYINLLKNPVPFNPKPVPGVSTEYDEYLPIISPDNSMALFTRKIKVPPSR